MPSTAKRSSWIRREEDRRNFLPTPAPPPYQRPGDAARREPGPAYRRILAIPPSPCHARRMTVVLALDPGSLFAAQWKG
jgi:hypothetical protein